MNYNFIVDSHCHLDLIEEKGLNIDDIIQKADENNVKVAVKEKLDNNQFGQASDFFRTDVKKYKIFYHHVGIYAFTNKALVRYVSLKRSKLELERKLEQLRALENSMSIHVGFIDSSPLSVDTKNDLIKVRKIMEKNI